MAKYKKQLIFGLVMWVLLILGTLVFDAFSIDSCLGSGGSFNYSIFECDMAQSHLIEPYLRARAGRFVGLTISFVVWSLFVLLYGIPSSKERNERL